MNKVCPNPTKPPVTCDLCCLLQWTLFSLHCISVSFYHLAANHSRKSLIRNLFLKKKLVTYSILSWWVQISITIRINTSRGGGELFYNVYWEIYYGAWVVLITYIISLQVDQSCSCHDGLWALITVDEYSTWI